VTRERIFVGARFMDSVGYSELRIPPAVSYIGLTNWD